MAATRPSISKNRHIIPAPREIINKKISFIDKKISFYPHIKNLPLNCL